MACLSTDCLRYCSDFVIGITEQNGLRSGIAVRTPPAIAFGIVVRTPGIAGWIAVRWGHLVLQWGHMVLLEGLQWGEVRSCLSTDCRSYCIESRAPGIAVGTPPAIAIGIAVMTPGIAVRTPPGAIFTAVRAVQCCWRLYNSVHVQRVLLSWITLCEWSWLTLVTLVTGMVNIDGFAPNVKKCIYIINCVELWGREAVQLFVWTVSVQILGVFGLSGLCMTLYHLFRSDSACQDMCSHMSTHVLFSYPCQTQLILLFAHISFFVISNFQRGDYIVHSSEELRL